MRFIYFYYFLFTSTSTTATKQRTDIFADDTKMFRKVKNDRDTQHLQNNLNKLVKWSEKWQMLLNFGKCKCVHTGHGNLDVYYKMGDTVLCTTIKEKDLGVAISVDIKQ